MIDDYHDRLLRESKTGNCRPKIENLRITFNLSSYKFSILAPYFQTTRSEPKKYPRIKILVIDFTDLCPLRVFALSRSSLNLKSYSKSAITLRLESTFLTDLISNQT